MNVLNRSTVPAVATAITSSSARSLSKDLTPGPLLLSIMHTDDDDDDEEPPVKTRHTSSDTTEQHFNLSARPAMSPTPGQALSILSPTPPPGPAPTTSAPPVIYSLLTDDEEDDPNGNSDGGDNGESASSPECEMVGPGYATPPRYGGSSSRPIGVDLSEQERKRAWSQVLQTEQEIEEEEAAAILASEKREMRRRELMNAKRSFLDLD